MTSKATVRNLMLALASSALILSACGDTDDGTGDGGVTPGDGGAADSAQLFTLATGSYKIVSASMVTDGCMIGVDKVYDPATMTGVIGVSFPLTLDNTTGNTTLGNMQGTPPVYSLGSGRVGGNMGTLTMETDITAAAPSMCKLHRKVTSVLTLIGDLKFTLAVTRTDSMRMMCSEPAGVGDTCTSTFTWTFERDTSVDGGS
jgi:hypothetical protein